MVSVMDSSGNLLCKPMCWEGNISENWKRFEQRFNYFLVGRGDGTKSERIKTSLLLHVIGDRGLEIYNTFKFEDGEEMKLEIVCGMFKSYCTPKTNQTAERFKFLTRRQQLGESLQEFITKLKSLVKSCNYAAENQDEMVCDVLVIGLLDNRLREKLLRTEKLTLAEAEKICRAAQYSREQASAMNDRSAEDTVGMVHQVHEEYAHLTPHASRIYPRRNVTRPAPYSSASEGNQHPACNRCGTPHSLPGLNDGMCPAMGKTCRKCGKPDHYARMCRSKRLDRSRSWAQNSASRNRRQVNAVEAPIREEHTREEEQQPSEFFIDAVSKPTDYKYQYTCSTRRNLGIQRDWIIKGMVSKVYEVHFKVDTGAQANVISIGDLEKVNKNVSKRTDGVKIKPSVTKLYDYSGNEIPVKGKCDISITFSGGTITLPFIVVSGQGVPLIGLKSARDLKLINEISEVRSDGYEALREQFKDIFSGLGCLEGQYKIDIDPNVRPVVHPCRKVPFSIKKRLKKELQRMVDLGVIIKEDGPTDWVNSLVVVEKKSGDLRVCLDPRSLNKAVKREHFTLPTREDLMGEFAEAKYFTKLDATSGYWHVVLDEDSSKLTTFNTPFGRFRFLRLPFGLKSAGEVFHKKVAMLFENIEGVVTSMDDILISGKTKEEHDKRLITVLEKAHDANLRLNPKKCEFGVSSLTFMGDIYSAEGIKVDPVKVVAIQGMKAPTDKTGVQRFLGMVNYLGRFVPNLSDETVNLRALTHSKSSWKWSTSHQKEFEKLKQLISNDQIMKFYDPKLPIKISSDASKSGLGCVLMQKHGEHFYPVSYASRSMTLAESRYAMIEKELLGICYAFERFHQFVYGHGEVLVETDHKPLIPLFGKNLSNCPLRVQRLMIRLQKYDFEISFMPGKFLHTADALSRSDGVMNIASVTAEAELTEETNHYVDAVVTSLPVSQTCLEQIRHECKHDEQMIQVINYTLAGWPVTRRQCTVVARPFFNVKDELSVYKGIVFKGSQIVIPYTLQKDMLSKIHEGHLGETKCKNRARSVMYWPGMSHDIVNVVSTCSICANYRNALPREPLKSHDPPMYPSEKIGADLYSFDSTDYIIATDYYSGYPEIARLPSTKAKSVINFLKDWFCRYGKPETVFTDNGPQFDCEEFRDFVKKWDFVHETSSPYHSRSNGLVERSIQTVKNMLKKSIDGKSDFKLALLIYRNSPLKCGFSPSQLFFNRRLRDNLPVAKQLLAPDTKVCRDFSKEKHDQKSTMIEVQKSCHC